MSEPILRVRDLEVRRGHRTVVRGVSFDVRPGEVVAVVGPNGAGKSTLVEALGGILRPSGGTVTRHGRVATVLQEPGLARRSVRANLALALAWWGVPRRERPSRIDAALAALGVTHLARRPAAGLSGGERRRVHLARGIAVHADLLLLDEPFAGLDPTTHRPLVEDAAAVLPRAAGAAVVVLHDRQDAWALADRLLVLDGGLLAADGSPDRLLSAPPTVSVARFLGYDGELRDGDDVLLTTPDRVVVDAAGSHEATVERVVRTPTGSLLVLAGRQGTVRAAHTGPPPAVGSRVRFTLRQPARFPA